MSAIPRPLTPPCRAPKRAVGYAVLLAFARLAGWSNGMALGQADNPVYVDDSPQAWEMFRQAQDQARNNAGDTE